MKHNDLKQQAGHGASSVTLAKRPLKQLFEDRDRTQQGSKAEERAAEKILEEILSNER